jgi:hypothetical protein
VLEKINNTKPLEDSLQDECNFSQMRQHPQKLFQRHLHH